MDTLNKISAVALATLVLCGASALPANASTKDSAPTPSSVVTPGGVYHGGGNGKGGGLSGGPLPKFGTSAAYLACLKYHGVLVPSVSVIRHLDTRNLKVVAAMKACTGK